MEKTFLVCIIALTFVIAATAATIHIVIKEEKLVTY